MSQNIKQNWVARRSRGNHEKYPSHHHMHTPDLLSALHHNVCIVTKSDIVDAHSKRMGPLQNQQEIMLIKS